MFDPNSIITLTTDFGLDDPFVGVMKGVILLLNPVAKVVDVTHGIPAHDILAGALALRSSYRFFPSGTIHLAVVDPGVGSQRRPLLFVGEGYAFVGPDNGLFSLTIQSDAQLKVFHLVDEKYFLKPMSQTFHGRDIFAPVAAWLSRGTPPELLGPPVDDWIRLDWPLPGRVGAGHLLGTVLHVDRFGNLITNISLQDLTAGQVQEIRIGSERICRILRSYAEAEDGEVFAIVGSAGLLEISVKQASAAKLLGVGPGHEFEVRFA